ncbi:MAG TPA: ribosome recycling factor [Candidatus Coprenecus stercoripullorum]|nr:ribosome recycling factor [Candidatus Coprenecus stercoripullorum]
MADNSKEIIAAAVKRMNEAVVHLEEELKTYRAGKANPAVFNNVMVNYYGNPTPIPQVASVNVPDARTMLIQPWEKNLIPQIEKAIMDANLGFTPQNNGEQIRINVPPLTEERRKELVKRSRTEGESAKISVRNARRDAIDQLKKSQKDGMPEDVAKDAENSIQKEVDGFNKKIDAVLAAKEKEILTV